MKAKDERGYTVIELVVVIVVLAVLAIFFIIQKDDLSTTYYDQQRKTAINAMYYSLTDVYFPEHGYYPTSIEEDTLKAIDPNLLIDIYGIPIYKTENDSENTEEDGTEEEAQECEYKYEGLNCDGEGRCKQFKLSVELEKEPEFIKESN